MEHGVGTSVPRLLAINCNDIRRKYRRMSPAKLFFNLKIGLGVLAETHLREGEIEHVRFSRYAIIAKNCLVTGNRKGGGVLIIVRHSFREAERIPPNRRTRRKSPVL